MRDLFERFRPYLRAFFHNEKCEFAFIIIVVVSSALFIKKIFYGA